MTLERHAEIADKLEAFVLDQLPPAERRDVEAHLLVCQTCAQDARDLHDTFAAVGQSVPPIEPPPALRQRVLDAVTIEPQQARRVVVLKERRRPLWVSVTWAAAAAIILAVGVVAYRIEEARQQLATNVLQLREESSDLQERLRQYRAQTDLALSILTAGDMREIPLIGRDDAAAAAVRAYLSPTRGILVVADRMPMPPPGRVYQVWVIENDKPASAGLLGEESTGRGMLIATPPRPGGGSGGVTVAITDEPPGGLSAPSGTIRVAGSI